MGLLNLEKETWRLMEHGGKWNMEHGGKWNMEHGGKWNMEHGGKWNIWNMKQIMLQMFESGRLAFL